MTDKERKKLLRIKKVVFDKITIDEWEKIRISLVKRAMYGDVSATKLLLSYIVGSPTQPIEVSTGISKDDGIDRLNELFGTKNISLPNVAKIVKIKEEIDAAVPFVDIFEDECDSKE